MAQQTINVGTAPNDGTGTPLRTAFQYTNSNFSELYTAVGPSGNNIVVPGSATITGDLTVDTSTLKVDSTNNRVGVGTASPSGIFHAANLGTAGTTADNFNGYFSSANRNCSIYLLAKNTEGSNFYFGDGDNNTIGGIIYDHTSNYMRFDANGSEQMRLNATGLGIGVSPSNNLHVQGASGATAIRISAVTDGTLGFIGSASGLISGSPANNLAVRAENGLYLSGGGNATQFILNSSGNVGIGVTPSAWSGVTALQVSRGSFAADTGSYTLSQNVYNNGSNRYIASAAALQFQAIPGTGFLWYTAPSGTAGNVITFTERLRIKETGQLRFVPLASDPSGAEAGDVYYNSTSNKLKCYNGTTWNDLF